MDNNEKITFKKVGAESSTVAIPSEEKARDDIGGRQGKKSVFVFENKLGSRSYFTKEYSTNDEKEVRGIVNAYHILREKKFLVPNTVRFFIKDNKITLLMSDVSENGKYLIWGPSEGMTMEQIQELKEMKLGSSDLKTIEKMVNKEVEKANKEGVFLSFDNYHIRKPKTKNKIEIMLLDVNTGNIRHRFPLQGLKTNNKKSAKLFLERVKYFCETPIEEIKSILSGSVGPLY